MIISLCLHDEKWTQLSKINNNIRKCYYISSHGRVYNTDIKKFIKPFPDTRGYMCVNLSTPSKGKQKKYYIHRLVALSFIKNDDIVNKTQVNHLNGIKNQNFIENLEWALPIQNIAHSIEHGLRDNLYGVKHHKSIYSEEFIHEICRLISLGYSPKLICKELGIMENNIMKIKRLIKHIKRKEHWVQISSQYNI